MQPNACYQTALIPIKQHLLRITNKKQGSYDFYMYLPTSESSKSAHYLTKQSISLHLEEIDRP